MNEVWFNLMISGITMVVEIGVVSVIINYIVRKRETVRWAPARQIIVRSVAKSYSSLWNASNHAMNPNRSKDLQHENRLLFLQQVDHDLQRLERAIDLNAPALDSFLMPRISEFIDFAEELFRKLRYFVNLYNPELMQYDFVSDPPFNELAKMQRIVNELKKQYQDIFSDSKYVHENLMTVDELKTIWNTLEQNSDRLSFDIEGYQFRNGRVPYVIDRHTLRRLNPDGVSHGIVVQVFDIVK